MFSDDSINIHYRAPTSKLLKMNTFNEFELNRIKKLYNDELASRLQRSKSTRLPGSSLSASHQHQHRQYQQHKLHHNQQFNRGLQEQFFEQRRRTQSAERLLPTGRHFHRRRTSHESPDSSPFIDLNRYERAFMLKSARARQQRNVTRFGRALFDFQAKSERELSLRRGDLVEMLELLDHTWARVEDCQSGLQGLVPLNYIDYSVGCAVAKRDVSGQQRVLRTSFGSASSGRLAEPEQTLEAPLLPMSKGEPITLIRRLSGHWYVASNTRQAMGLVWSNDLDIIKQPVLGEPELTTTDYQRPSSARSASRNSNLLPQADKGVDDSWSDEEAAESGYNEHDEQMFLQHSGERLLARRRRAKSASGLQECPMRQSCLGEHQSQCCVALAGPEVAQQCCNRKSCVCAVSTLAAAQQLPRRSSSSPFIHISSAGQQMSSSQHQQQQLLQEPALAGGVEPATSQQVSRFCRAKFAYKARQKDELDLVPGAVYLVVHECDDGWFIGSSCATKEMGTFPGNFVEPI